MSFTTEASIQYRFNPGKNWQKRKIGAVIGWVARDASKATIVINTDASRVGDYSVTKTSVPKMIQYLEQVKKFQGQAFNITDWKVRRHQFYRLKGNQGALVKLEGDYKGITGVPTRFVEWHYYIGKHFYQITYTQNSNRGKWSMARIESILKRFRPLGV